MSHSSLRVLVEMLACAPPLVGCHIAFGEEMIHAQDFSQPVVTVVPIGGPWAITGIDPAYVQALDPDVEIAWSTQERIDLHLWNASRDPARQQPLDHASAVEDFRELVLQALQRQRAPGGLFYKPVFGEWVQMNDQVVRQGRAYKLSVVVELATTDIDPVEATVQSITIVPSIVVQHALGVTDGFARREIECA